MSDTVGKNNYKSSPASSQHGQDRYVYETFFKDQKTGYMVDIGANDGLAFSNSKFFEDIGWDGALVEANPLQHAALKKNRNKGWKIFTEAVVPHSTGETVDFLAFPPDDWGWGLSGVVDAYDSQHLNRIELEHDQGYIKAIPEPVKVSTISINDVLDGVPEVDFLSIDVEGGEAELLGAIDYDKHYVKVIAVENNYDQHKYREIMLNNGFVMITKLGCDEIYMNSDFLLSLPDKQAVLEDIKKLTETQLHIHNSQHAVWTVVPVHLKSLYNRVLESVNPETAPLSHTSRTDVDKMTAAINHSFARYFSAQLKYKELEITYYEALSSKCAEWEFQFECETEGLSLYQSIFKTVREMDE